MDEKNVVDYLGHPCRFTQAKTRFEESIFSAERKEFREIKRKVGALLLELSDRVTNALYGSTAIRNLVGSLDGSDESCALIEMLSAYQLETTNIYEEFAGLILVGFESENYEGEA